MKRCKDCYFCCHYDCNEEIYVCGNWSRPRLIRRGWFACSGFLERESSKEGKK